MPKQLWQVTYRTVWDDYELIVSPREFILKHSDVLREDGAFTFSAESTSLIDHICACPGIIGKCGIAVTSSFFSDHSSIDDLKKIAKALEVAE